VRSLIRGLEWVVIALMGTITLVVIVESALRGLFGFSLIVTSELSRYLMVWTAMLAAGLLIHEDGHIRITLLTDAVPPRVATALFVLSEALVLFFLALMIVSSLMLMPSLLEQSTVTLGVSMAWFYAALPVGGALMFGLVVVSIVRRLAASVRAP
jgi:TRAP-type C4-dicarboxylate transport system permease small subunit